VIYYSNSSHAQNAFATKEQVLYKQYVVCSPSPSTPMLGGDPNQADRLYVFGQLNDLRRLDKYNLAFSQRLNYYVATRQNRTGLHGTPKTSH